MPYYKTPDNTVHFLDSAQFEHLLPSDAVPITNAEAEALRPIPAPAKVTIVSMRQARLILLHYGLLDTVDESIALMPDPIQRTQAQIDWEFATTVDRNSPLVNGLAGALALTDEQLDTMFQEASKL